MDYLSPLGFMFHLCFNLTETPRSLSWAPVATERIMNHKNAKEGVDREYRIQDQPTMTDIPMTTRFLIGLMLVILGFAAPLIAETVQAEIPALKSDQGYLLFEYQTPGSATKVEFAKVGLRGVWSQTPLQLNQTDQQFKVLVLKRGTYQIQSVSVPYFDLPFKKDVSDNRRWRFTIEAGKVNYAGALLVAPERSSDYVRIELKNRWATSLNEMRASYSELLNAYPWVINMAYEDPFPQKLESLNAK